MPDDDLPPDVRIELSLTAEDAAGIFCTSSSAVFAFDAVARLLFSTVGSGVGVAVGEEVAGEIAGEMMSAVERIGVRFASLGLSAKLPIMPHSEHEPNKTPMAINAVMLLEGSFLTEARSEPMKAAIGLSAGIEFPQLLQKGAVVALAVPHRGQ